MKIDLNVLSLSLLGEEFLLETLGQDVKKWLTPDYSVIYGTITWYYYRYNKVPSVSILREQIKQRYSADKKVTQYQSILDQLELNNLPESATVNYLLDELSKEYRKRLLTESLTAAVSDLKQGQVDKCYTDLSELILSVNDTKYRDFIEQGNAVSEALADWEEYEKTEFQEQEVGVLCGIREIDQRLFGIKPGELGVLSGRPGIGKSALLLNFGYYPFFFMDKNVLYISLEMRYAQVKMRMHARGALISYTSLKNKKLEETSREIYKDYLHTLAQKKGIFHILDIPFKVDAGYLETHIARLNRAFPLDLIIVDYLGNMNSKNSYGSRWESQGEACIELRELARKYHIPIWTATQLTRGSTESEDLDTSHIAYSDMIAQTADYIIGIYESKESRETDTVMMTMMKSRDSDKAKNFKVNFERDKMIVTSLVSEEYSINWD